MRMKKFRPFCLSVLLLGSFSVNAQKPVVNHIAHHVIDLQKSTAFYKDLIGLDTIPEPFHDGKHTWFSIGYKSHLHLIAGATAVADYNKQSHLCFTVPSVDAFVTRLTKAGIAFEDLNGKAQTVTLRVDGVKQIYFKDPDGFWIEINDARE